MDNESDEFPFLHEACSPRLEHKIDIVFVHGLNPHGRSGYPFEAWTHQNGSCWPTDFVAEDLPFARIFIYGYNSNVARPDFMSAGRIKNHADTLLNLLDLERGSAQGPSPAKIIFVGHSLGGLVIKHALLNAQENPKYNSIRTATSGLVFFACPHHGAKGAELGMIAADVARFVSADSASNELLKCLETNTLLSRQMSERFRHQLEDYRVVSFIEGMPMRLGGTSQTSVCQLVVEEESAVLGLTGLRETQLMLDADHIGICKIGSRGAMYKLVIGNIKSLVDQPLGMTRRYDTLPSMRPSPSTPYLSPPFTNPFPPPLPPRQSASDSSYPTDKPPENELKVTGVLYLPEEDDENSILLAEYKNKGLWQKAQQLETQIFQEQHRTLGPKDLKTLSTAHNLASTLLELGFITDASKWATWAGSTSLETLGPKHPLSMKSESLIGEILLEQSQEKEANIRCTNILARQQEYLGDDHPDTLETLRRLGRVCQFLGRRQDAFDRLQKRSSALLRILGDTHVQAIAATLDLIEAGLPAAAGDILGTARSIPQIQHAASTIQPLYLDLRGTLGPQHPLSIRTLGILGVVKLLEGYTTEALDTLRRALTSAEDVLGLEHPATVKIVAMISVVYCKKLYCTESGVGTTGCDPAEMRPWLERYLTWTEKRRGDSSREAITTLKTLALSYAVERDYPQAERYFARLVAAISAQNSPEEAREAANMLQLVSRRS